MERYVKIKEQAPYLRRNIPCVILATAANTTGFIFITSRIEPKRFYDSFLL